MPATKGYRKRMRKLFSKRRMRKGLSQYMIEYEIGELVHININPINMSTAPHKRYQGMVGKIIGKRLAEENVKENLKQESMVLLK